MFPVLLLVGLGLMVGPAVLKSADSGKTPEQQLAEAERLAWLKNWSKAESFFAAAETGFTARGDRRNTLFARISRIRAELPRRALAATSEELAALLDEPVVQADNDLKLRCLVVKGDVDLDHDVELAHRDWTEARAVAEQLGHKAWVNRADGELGIVAFLRGDSRTAVMNLLRALQRAEALGDVAGQIRYLSIVGTGMTEFGRGEQAIPMFDKAIALADAHPDLNISLMTYVGKAQALLSLNKKADARELMDKALLIARKNEAYGYEADLRLQMGLLAAKAGDSTGAVEQFSQAAAIAAKVNGHRLIALANLHISEHELKNGNLDQAERASLAGLASSREAGDRYFLPKHLAQYAEVLSATKRYAAADEAYEAAADIMSGMLVNSASSGTKASLIAIMDRLYVGHFKTEAVHLRRLDRALEAIEHARGRALSDVIRARLGNETTLPARLSAAERQISRLQIELGKAKTRVQRRRLLNSLMETEHQLSPLQADYEKAWLQREMEPVSLARLRAVLRPDEVLLEYVLDQPTSYCLAIQRTGISLHRLPSKAAIGKLIDRFNEDVQQQDGVPRSAGQELFRSLLGHLPTTGKTRLVIVPDGALNRLAFDELPSADGRHLVHSRITTYSPSATAFYALRQRTTSSRAPLLAVAPTPSSADAANSVNSGRKGLPEGVFDAPVSKLPALPAARGEVAQIAEVMGPGSRVLVGADATESAVKSEPLHRYKAVHFAAHALVSTKYPDRSALVLEAGTKEDGLLQAREIGRLRLDAELVTLSSCEAGSGRITGQEGVANLVRPFLVGGARTVVANLWPVDDEFSRALMKSFYTHLAAGADTALALNRAKRELIRRYGDQAHSRLWAGFIAVGDNRKLARTRVLGD